MTRTFRIARVCLALAGCALLAPVVRAQTVRSDFYITNGQVSAEVLRGNTLYVGGSFSFIGPVTGAGVPVDATTAQPEAGFPQVNGTVMAAVPDGGGGWYVGGLFTAVDGSPRTNLAHVLSDHSVAAWDPAPASAVRALALRSGVLYVGGDFLSIAGVNRNRIAAIDPATGVAAAWNPNSNSSVRVFAVGAGVLYVGGQFTTIGGQARNRVAALDFATGAADPAWNPNSNSLVMSLWLDPVASVVYIGGQFTTIGAQPRNRIASVDATTGLVSGWNPNANNQVLAVTADAGVVYVAGQFSSIGGQSRNRIAAIDASTGLASAWNPNASSKVQALALSGAILYAGGDFLAIGGQPRSRLAALSTATGLATSWDPTAFSTVSVVVPNAGVVFAGGTFNAVGGTPRNNLAAVDVPSGQVTAWNPNANNQVQALFATPQTLYVGGNFSLIGGQIRNNVAALDLTNGLATPWDANADGQVSALALTGGRVYLGGLFTTVGGQPRSDLAAVSAATGAIDPWTADADNQVFTIETAANIVYVGGNFSTLNGIDRNFAGALDAVTGAVTAWNPDATGTVRAVVATCDRIYLGGFFTMIGAAARNRLAAVNYTTGQALAWDPNANGPIFAVTPANGAVYVGGVISTLGSQARNRIGSVDPVTGAVTAWNPNSNGTIRCIAADATGIYLGGAFSTMGIVPSGNLAAVSTDNSTPCPVITLTSPPLAAAIAGTAYATSITATGGAAPYCYTVRAGSLPAGLALDTSTGQVSGTPVAAGVGVFSITATDSRGCAGTVAYTLTVTSAPAVNSVAANGAGLCLNALQTCVPVPFALTRGDATGLRAVSVTLQLEAAKLRLCSPGTPGANAHPGTWASTFTNRSLQVTDLGGGRYTVDVVILGQPCGATAGGSLFTLDVAAQGPLGTGSIAVTSVVARDCANGPVAVSAGPATTVNITNAAIVLSPSSLPGVNAGAPYSQTISASGGTPPYAFTVTAGALPLGITLASSGGLSGTASQGGTFGFTVTAAETDGCSGSRAYSIAVACPVLAMTPAFLPDGAIGAPYDVTLGAANGNAPLTFSLTAGSLPAGLTLSPAGHLSGTPTLAASSVFTVGLTDGAGCTGGESYTLDIFASEPVSSVAAVTTGLAISTAHPCVSVPVVFTRGESVPARALSVSFQIDSARLALCGPAASSIHLGSWFDGFANTSLQIQDLGSGAYTVDVALLGEPCGITTGGTLFTVDLHAAGPDGAGAITMTRVKARGCDNAAIAVRAGDPASLRIQNTPITLSPATLPNALVGIAYSQAITADTGAPPFTFSVSAGALPPGLTLSAGGTLSGRPTANGSASFTVSVSDAGDVQGSRAYTMSVTCPVIAITPSSLPDAQVGAAYSQTLSASGGTPPHAFSIASGSLPDGLSLAATGEITGTPTAAGAAVFSIAAADSFGCTGTEVYTLPVFVDPAISRIAANAAGLCLSANHTCVNVPFVYARGDSVPAAAFHVTFRLDPRLALCGSPSQSIHAGDWLAGFANTTFQVVDAGGGSYSVDAALLGPPCGPTHGGVLFTVDVASAGSDGAGDITVTDSHVRDCANHPVPGEPGAPAQLVVSHVPPPAISDLASVQILSGNSGSRTGITVQWTSPAPGAIALYRAPFGSYPEYDDNGGTAPDSAAAPGPPWTLVSASATPGLVDHPPVRGFWHYVAFLTDSCGNRSAVSNLSTGALDYHLGDVSDGVTRGTGNDRVGLEDVSLLGAHYGISGSTIVTDNVAYLDVGPTVNGLTTGRPTTDDVIDFEDLMLFSLNFHVVSGPQAIGEPAAAVSGKSEAFELAAPALVQPGDDVVATLNVQGAGAMQGFSTQLAWNSAVLEPVGVESGGFLEAQGGVLLSPRAGIADAALLGVRAAGIAGDGVAARFRFHVLREGDGGLRIAKVVARDRANRGLEPGGLARSVVAAIPAHTMLLAPTPNPAVRNATIAFGLAEHGNAELAIFGIDGRRVKTLAHGPRDAGAWRITWQGDDQSGHEQAPGVYWAKLDAGGRTFTRRIVFLR